MNTPRILKPLLSNDCKTIIVYSVSLDASKPKFLQLDWQNAIPVMETGSQQEAAAFCQWAK